MNRNDLLRANLNRSYDTGVEIGPFYNPIAAKADGWKTIIIDFADGAYLRNLAKNHASMDIRARAKDIEDVDIVWKGEPINEAVRKISSKPINYVIASHVIEHIPDFISFFQHCDILLNSNSIISLAVPDLRRCFDVFKSPSNLSDILLAYRQKRTLHAPETMLQAWTYCVLNEREEGSWLKQDAISPMLAGSLESDYQRYVEYLDNHEKGKQEYVDAHAWHFTPASFEMTIIELNALGLINFRIDSLELTDGAEFIVQLKKGKYNYSKPELHAHRTNMIKKRFYELQEIKIK